MIELAVENSELDGLGNAGGSCRTLTSCDALPNMAGDMWLSLAEIF
jgi:hypothetical protein